MRLPVFFIGIPCWLRQYSVCLQWGRPGFDTWVVKIPWRRKWQPPPILMPRKFHGWRSLVAPGGLQSMGYSTTYEPSSNVAIKFCIIPVWISRNPATSWVIPTYQRKGVGRGGSKPHWDRKEKLCHMLHPWHSDTHLGWILQLPASP